MSHWIPARKYRRRAQLGLALTEDKPKPRVISDTPLEADVQRAVLKLLKMHPSVAWAERFNSRVVDVADARSKTGTRPMRMAFKGCSDVLGQLKTGRLLAVECKRPGGTLTDEQRTFLTTVNANGGLGLCVDSVDALLKYLPMPTGREGLDIL